MSDYIVCVRNIKGDGTFGNEPGETTFLKLPPTNLFSQPTDAILRSTWVDEVILEASTGINEHTGKASGDILVLIHGYNNDQNIVIKRHRRLAQDLKAVGFSGVVISFDWPSASSPLNYLEDRDDAKDTARFLRDDCITLFSAQQVKGCEINVHLLAHSTGAYVVRQAFSEADEKSTLKNRPWSVSQIAFIGGDISSKSLSESDSKSISLYRHCVRLTNYQNPYDSVLKLSNVKRIGLSPRVGRIGLPVDANEQAVNVNCGNYFKSLDEDTLVSDVDYFGNFSHSWHIGNLTFTQDLYETIKGDLDRYVIPTRKLDKGELVLI